MVSFVRLRSWDVLDSDRLLLGAKIQFKSRDNRDNNLAPFNEANLLVSKCKLSHCLYLNFLEKPLTISILGTYMIPAKNLGGGGGV
jgi:hypothetical protein